MDSALQVVSVLASPVFGLMGVWLGGHLQARKDDERWERDLSRENDRWRREDRRRWLDEQYRLYTDLMAAVSDALQASKRAYHIHPAFAGRRQDEAEIVRLRQAATEAVTGISPALQRVALMGHDEISNCVWELYGALHLAAVDGRRGKDLDAMRSLEEATDLSDELRSRIRRELGVEVTTDEANSAEESSSLLSQGSD